MKYSKRQRAGEFIPTLISGCLLVTFTLASALFIGCRNPYDREIATDAFDDVTEMEWKSRFSVDIPTRFRTSRLGDGSVLVVADRRHGDYFLERIDVERDSILWSEHLKLRRDEDLPMILTHDDHSFLLTQMDEGSGARTVFLRRISHSDGSAIDMVSLVSTGRGYDRDLETILSPDSSHLFIYGLGDRFSVRNAHGDKRPARLLAASVLELRDGSYSSVVDTVIYDDGYDDDWWPRGVVSNEGRATILEIVEGDDDLFELFIHRLEDGERSFIRSRVPNREDEILPGSKDDDRLTPGRLGAGVSYSGTVLASWVLKDGDEPVAIAVASIDEGSDSVRHGSPFIFTETAIRSISAGHEREVREQQQMEGIVTYGPGGYTVISSASSTGRHETSTVIFSTTCYPFLLLHFSPEGALTDTSWIRRYEIWIPNDGVRFESDHSVNVVGDRLQILTRERYFGGIMVYRIDPATGIFETVRIARVPMWYYLGTNMTVWNDPREVTMFVKKQLVGDGWKILSSRF